MKANIGIEICEQHFKMAVATFQGPHPKLANVMVEPIVSMNDEQQAAKFQGALRAAKVRPKFVRLSVARNLVTVRNLHLPSQDKKEIDQMIALNVARIVPYKKEEITFGSRFLGVDEMGYTKVILAIVNSNVLRRQVKLLERAGLFIDKVVLSSSGVWEWVVTNHRAELNQVDLYLLLDIDSAFADFIIFSSNNILFTRSINMGVGSIREAGEMGVTKLLGEVKQSLITFYNEELNKKPVAVYLSGADIKSELKQVVEAELGLPVKLVASPHPADFSLIAVSALSLRDIEGRISFTLPEIQIRKALREKTKDLIILGSFFIYFFTALFAIFLGRVYSQQTYLNRLDREYEAIEEDMSELLPKLRDIDVVKENLGLRRIPLVVFSELQNGLPPEIIMTYIGIDDQNRIVIRGQAPQLSDVFKFVGTLEKVKFFKGVETRSTRKKKIKEKDMTEFELNFAFNV